MTASVDGKKGYTKVPDFEDLVMESRPDEAGCEPSQQNASKPETKNKTSAPAPQTQTPTQETFKDDFAMFEQPSTPSNVPAQPRAGIFQSAPTTQAQRRRNAEIQIESQLAPKVAAFEAHADNFIALSQNFLDGKNYYLQTLDEKRIAALEKDVGDVRERVDTLTEEMKALLVSGPIENADRLIELEAELNKLINDVMPEMMAAEGLLLATGPSFEALGWDNAAGKVFEVVTARLIHSAGLDVREEKNPLGTQKCIDDAMVLKQYVGKAFELKAVEEKFMGYLPLILQTGEAPALSSSFLDDNPAVVELKRTENGRREKIEAVIAGRASLNMGRNLDAIFFGNEARPEGVDVGMHAMAATLGLGLNPFSADAWELARGVARQSEERYPWAVDNEESGDLFALAESKPRSYEEVEIKTDSPEDELDPFSLLQTRLESVDQTYPTKTFDEYFARVDNNIKYERLAALAEEPEKQNAAKAADPKYVQMKATELSDNIGAALAMVAEINQGIKIAEEPICVGPICVKANGPDSPTIYVQQKLEAAQKYAKDFLETGNIESLVKAQEMFSWVIESDAFKGLDEVTKWVQETSEVNDIIKSVPKVIGAGIIASTVAGLAVEAVGATGAGGSLLYGFTFGFTFHKSMQFMNTGSIYDFDKDLGQNLATDALETTKMAAMVGGMGLAMKGWAAVAAAYELSAATTVVGGIAAEYAGLLATSAAIDYVENGVFEGEFNPLPAMERTLNTRNLVIQAAFLFGLKVGDVIVKPVSGPIAEAVAGVQVKGMGKRIAKINARAENVAAKIEKMKNDPAPRIDELIALRNDLVKLNNKKLKFLKELAKHTKDPEVAAKIEEEIAALNKSSQDIAILDAKIQEALLAERPEGGETQYLQGGVGFVSPNGEPILKIVEEEMVAGEESAEFGFEDKEANVPTLNTDAPNSGSVENFTPREPALIKAKLKILHGDNPDQPRWVEVREGTVEVPSKLEGAADIDEIQPNGKTEKVRYAGFKARAINGETIWVLVPLDSYSMAKRGTRPTITDLTFLGLEKPVPVNEHTNADGAGAINSKAAEKQPTRKSGPDFEELGPDGKFTNEPLFEENPFGNEQTLVDDGVQYLGGGFGIVPPKGSGEPFIRPAESAPHKGFRAPASAYEGRGAPEARPAEGGGIIGWLKGALGFSGAQPAAKPAAQPAAPKVDPRKQVIKITMDNGRTGIIVEGGSVSPLMSASVKQSGGKTLLIVHGDFKATVYRGDKIIEVPKGKPTTAQLENGDRVIIRDGAGRKYSDFKISSGSTDTDGLALPRQNDAISHNLDMLHSGEFIEASVGESMGGNAGSGKLGVNGYYDASTGKIVEFSNYGPSSSGNLRHFTLHVDFFLGKIIGVSGEHPDIQALNGVSLAVPKEFYVPKEAPALHQPGQAAAPRVEQPARQVVRPDEAPQNAEAYQPSEANYARLDLPIVKMADATPAAKQAARSDEARSANPSDFKAKTLAELDAFTKEGGTLQQHVGTVLAKSKKYKPEEMWKNIRDVLNGKAPLETITNSEGKLRELVQGLMQQRIDLAKQAYIKDGKDFPKRGQFSPFDGKKIETFADEYRVALHVEEYVRKQQAELEAKLKQQKPSEPMHGSVPAERPPTPQTPREAAPVKTWKPKIPDVSGLSAREAVKKIAEFTKNGGELHQFVKREFGLKADEVWMHVNEALVDRSSRPVTRDAELRGIVDEVIQVQKTYAERPLDQASDTQRPVMFGYAEGGRAVVQHGESMDIVSQRLLQKIGRIEKTDKGIFITPSDGVQFTIERNGSHFGGLEKIKIEKGDVITFRKDGEVVEVVHISDKNVRMPGSLKPLAEGAVVSVKAVDAASAQPPKDPDAKRAIMLQFGGGARVVVQHGETQNIISQKSFEKVGTVEKTDEGIFITPSDGFQFSLVSGEEATYGQTGKTKVSKGDIIIFLKNGKPVERITISDKNVRMPEPGPQAAAAPKPAEPVAPRVEPKTKESVSDGIVSLVLLTPYDSSGGVMAAKMTNRNVLEFELQKLSPEKLQALFDQLKMNETSARTKIQILNRFLKENCDRITIAEDRGGLIVQDTEVVEPIPIEKHTPKK